MPYPHTSGDRQTQKDPNELGALWEKQSPSGETYYSGEINGQRVVVFPVKKRSERGPALRVLKSTAQGQGTQSQRQAPLARASRPTVEDIPF